MFQTRNHSNNVVTQGTVRIMLLTIARVTILYDLFFYIALSRFLYIFIYQAEEIGLTFENEISRDRLDPGVMSSKDLFALLDRREEIYQKSDYRDNKNKLITIAKSKVFVEESHTPDLLDLESLSIQELKRLLDQRGIMYYSSTSKEDLITAVNVSGPVIKEAVDLTRSMNDPDPGPVVEFNVFNVDPILEKYNDNIFLINIIPARLEYAHLSKSSWKALQRKLSYMNFKFAELDCDFERSICIKLKVTHSTLYLYVPGNKAKKITYTINEDYSIHRLYIDIEEQVAHAITKIDSWETLTSSNWTFYSNKRTDAPVRVIFFANMTRSPLFMSALSIKHRKKINFGHVNMASRKSRNILRKLKLKHWPVLLVVTKQHILTYGTQKGELYTFSQLDSFLQVLLRNFKPETKWYHNLSFLLDPLFIGILLVRFVFRNSPYILFILSRRTSERNLVVF